MNFYVIITSLDVDSHDIQTMPLLTGHCIFQLFNSTNYFQRIKSRTPTLVIANGIQDRLKINHFIHDHDIHGSIVYSLTTKENTTKIK